MLTGEARFVNSLSEEPHPRMSKNQNVIFGVNPVLEKLRTSVADIEEVLISEGSDRSALRLIRQQATGLGLRVVTSPRQILDRLVGGQRHQGVIAKVKPYRYLSVELLLERTADSLKPEWILVLDGLTDPRNFGALLRTAEAVGIHYILIPKDRSAEVTPLAIKASAGAAYHLEIVRVTNLHRALVELKRIGFWTVGLDASVSRSVYDANYPSRLAIILGSEGKGIRPVILRECDFVVSIPMLGKVASLNVGAAGAVFLYEILRQTQIGKGRLGRPSGVSG
jgi:23S rRNA (guanosine2251-2'-O)-methyltransferase